MIRAFSMVFHAPVGEKEINTGMQRKPFLRNFIMPSG